MTQAEVVQTGKTSDGRNWALIQKEQQGFLVSAMVNPVEEVEVGQELEIPSSINVNWEA